MVSEDFRRDRTICLYTVLILVLVEDGLRVNVLLNESWRQEVLILVVVEDGLRVAY